MEAMCVTPFPSPSERWFHSQESLKIVTLPLHIQRAILGASIRAKTIFDDNGWEWNGAVPSLGEIVDLYTKLTGDVLAWPEIGNARFGRLIVEMTDEILEFSVEIGYVEV